MNQAITFILTFHGLGEPTRQLPASEMDCWIDTAVFEAILNDVRGRQDVQITFDDSNESDYSIALPRLKARGLSAQFFVVAGRIGLDTFLSANQLRQLHAEGMNIGSHGMCHRNWRDLTRTEFHEELVEAKDSIQQLIGAPVLEAACPYGSYDRRVLKELRHSGYGAVYTSDEGPASFAAWLRPRNTVRRSHRIDRVRSSITEAPVGLRKLVRDIKLLIKRWR